MKHWKRLMTLFLLAALLVGGQPARAAGAATDLLLPEASGTAVKQSSKAVIDYSHAADGYVMVRFTAATSKKLKAMVIGPSSEKYTYNLTAGQWVTLPLSQGNGSYKVGVYENVTGTKYAEAAAASISVTLTDEFAPFLRPNQYVDYAPAEKTIAKARELAGSETDALKLVEKVYGYVVSNMSYDKQLAAKVSGASGYLPVLDSVLDAKKGICFDYGSLTAGMLRALGIPCKLVVGYAGKAYHAWINVWTKETGWVEKVIYFDGNTWVRMDPTFASSSKRSESIMKYIGDGSNYTPQKFY